MKRLVLSVLAALALVSGAIAQDMKTTVTGTVVTATNDQLVIDTPTGQMTFKLDSMLDRVKYNDLKPGTRVTVVHKMDDQGLNMVVTDVNTLSEPSTPPATTTPPAATYGDNTNKATDSRVAYGNDRLPATASPLALVALLGVSAAIGGWVWRKKATSV